MPFGILMYPFFSKPNTVSSEVSSNLKSVSIV